MAGSEHTHTHVAMYARIWRAQSTLAGPSLSIRRTDYSTRAMFNVENASLLLISGECGKERSSWREWEKGEIAVCSLTVVDFLVIYCCLMCW